MRKKNSHSRALKIIKSLKKIFLSKSIGSHNIVTASWIVTSRCNLSCPHCGVYLKEEKELDTNGSIRLIDFLHSKKIGWVFISGGEPLIREDIGLLIDSLKKRGVGAGISSNGTLLSERIKELKNSDKIILSLDGPPEIHDLIRGEGTYRALMRGVASAKKMGISLNFTYVLLKDNCNIKSIDFILDKSRELKIPLSVQPGRLNRLDSGEKNYSAPDEDEYKKIIDYLIERKKSGYRWLFNSIPGLKFLRQWPKPRRIPCVAGKLHMNITPGGFMRSCLVYSPGYVKENESRVCSDFEKEFAALPRGGCSDCWCAEFVEFNKAYNMRPASALTVLKEVAR